MIQPTANIESPELNVDSMLAGIEDNINQRNYSWDVPYTFSGKEKDAEIKLLDIAELKFLSKRFRLSISIKFVIAFTTKTN